MFATQGSRPGSPGISLNSSDLLSSGPSSVSRLSLSNPRLFGSGLGKIRSFTQVRHSFSSGKSTEYEQLGESAGGELESFRDSLDRRRPKKVSFQECRSDGLRPVVPHRWYNSVDSVGTVRRKDAGWIGRFSSSFHRAIRWSMEGVGENTDLIGTGPVANL